MTLVLGYKVKKGDHEYELAWVHDTKQITLKALTTNEPDLVIPIDKTFNTISSSEMANETRKLGYELIDNSFYMTSTNLHLHKRNR